MFKINPQKVFLSYHKFYFSTFVIDFIGCTFLRFFFLFFYTMIYFQLSIFLWVCALGGRYPPKLNALDLPGAGVGGRLSDVGARN